MTKLFRGDERGAVSGYVAGLIVLAVLLIGGVMLLKHVEGNKADTRAPMPVSTGEFKADDTEDKKDESKPEPTPTDGSEKTEIPTTTVPSDIPDEKLAATGPEDFLAAVIGLVLVGGTIYATYYYAKSRSAVKTALLRK